MDRTTSHKPSLPRPSSAFSSTTTTTASTSTHKARQYAHLHAQLAQLNAHLADTENLLRMTAVQAQDMRFLGGPKESKAASFNDMDGDEHMDADSGKQLYAVDNYLVVFAARPGRPCNWECHVPQFRLKSCARTDRIQATIAESSNLQLLAADGISDINVSSGDIPRPGVSKDAPTTILWSLRVEPSWNPLNHRFWRGKSVHTRQPLEDRKAKTPGPPT